MFLTYLLFFGAAFLLALILTPVVRTLSIHFGFLDAPGKRKVHKEDIPRLGGVAVFIAMGIPFGVILLSGHFRGQQAAIPWQPLFGLVLGCLIVFGIGVWDDIRRLPPWPKLTAEIGASLVVFMFGLKVQFVFNPFGPPLDIPWLNGFLTILWLVGITNALNLADGIDGLATGIATFAAAVLFAMTLPTVYALVPFLAIALCGACLGFLRYNFSPATIFLGDSGSLFLGFCLGCLSLWASEKSVIAFALFIPITVLGLPIVDMIYAVLRRWHRGVPLGQADRDHIHHRLLEKGFSHRRAVLMLYGINFFLAALAGFLLITRNSLAAYVIVILGIGSVLGSRILGYFRFSGLFQDLITRWRDSQKVKYLAFRTRMLARAFEEEKSLAGRWVLVGELFEEVGIQRAEITSKIGPTPSLTWIAKEPSEPGNKIVSFSLPLSGKKETIGNLEILWCASQGAFPPGMSRIINMMANEFCHNLEP
jgi:UDP-GlcNAc:undecaprenyl-phosphate/decaprenyl-phosphate GlcNAc-1-phosphate transferase